MEKAKFKRSELDSIYIDEVDRFVVSLIVGYGSRDGVKTPKDAGRAALQLTTDEGSRGTNWYVFDRKTGKMHRFEQEQLEENW